MDDTETIMNATHLHLSECLEGKPKWHRPRQVCAGEFYPVSKVVAVVALCIFQQYSKYRDQYDGLREMCFAKLKGSSIMSCWTRARAHKIVPVYLPAPIVEVDIMTYLAQSSFFAHGHFLVHG